MKQCVGCCEGIVFVGIGLEQCVCVVQVYCWGGVFRAPLLTRIGSVDVDVFLFFWHFFLKVHDKGRTRFGVVYFLSM